MKNTQRINARKIILAETFTMTTFATVAVVAAILVVPTVQQFLPSAYAATATGSSAITEGACSTGSFADNLLASFAGSCGPNLSGSAAGDMAICRGEDGSVALALGGATCSIGY